MKQLIATLFVAILCCSAAKAQTIVDDLQKEETGKGKVKVKHSKEIDILVNGEQKTVTPQQAQKKQNDKTEKKPETPQKPDSTAIAKDKTDDKKTDDPAKEQRKEPVRHAVTPTESESETKTTDVNRKKVMRNAQKITGYRVQVFSGGSSRQDRQKAQEARNKVKAKFPDLPVYVHFYSPSWKCRVGNFRTYNEANKVLKQIKALGYSQACIVKGKINVQ